MANYHINTETGNYGLCSTTPTKCPFGDNGDKSAIHIDGTIKDIQKFSEKILVNKYGTFKKHSPQKTQLRNKEKELFIKNFENMTKNQLKNYINESPEKYNMVDELVKERSSTIKQKQENLEKYNPYKNNFQTSKTFDEQKQEYYNMLNRITSERNSTAELVEALTISKHFKPAYENLKNDSELGKLVKASSYDVNSIQGQLDRRTCLGGSDIAMLVNEDFTKPEDRPTYNKEPLKKLIQLKTDTSKQPKITPDPYKNMWRGTVWESRIRDEFTKDNPDLKVYNTKHQYVNPNIEWQKINVDGVLSNRKDGKPNGLLEIKTASSWEQWKNGIPDNYRAQSLYYLQATGMDYIKIRVKVSDSEHKDYTLNKNDEIVKGCGINMEQYMNTRIKPFAEKIFSKK